MVQLPPGAINPLHVLVCVKALDDPFANVIPEMVRFKLPVLVKLVVTEELRVVKFSAPVFTNNLVTLVFRSVT